MPLGGSRRCATARPDGARLGGYGVLEDVRPSPLAEPLSHGYIHAPSLGQAATAAVLRSGYLAHRREQDSPLAVDLSSRRVRLALGLLEGVRAGQPLAAILGYRFERGLHDHHPALILDRFIAPLRGIAPLDPLTEAEHALGVAEAHERDLADQIGLLEQQLAALRDADRATKNQLRAALAAAQADLTAAEAAAGAASNRLEARQAELQALLDEAATGAPRLPPWKIGGDTIPEAGMTPAMRARLNTLTREVRTLAGVGGLGQRPGGRDWRTRHDAERPALHRQSGDQPARAGDHGAAAGARSGARRRCRRPRTRRRTARPGA